MDVVKALTICGGAARQPALFRLGVDDAALRRAVRSGAARQPCRGLYALPTAVPDYVALLQRRQLLTCVSAAPFYGLWALEPTVPGMCTTGAGKRQTGNRGTVDCCLSRIRTGRLQPWVMSSSMRCAACRSGSP